MTFTTPKQTALLIFALLFSFGVAQANQSVWKDVDRIVAVGDVHGDYSQFVKTLRAAKVINTDNQWIGGKTHLVQTGDILDRGPDSRKVMDLLMALEVQALAAGGRVHALTGNHEAMIMYHDLRYVHPDEYTSYGGKESYLEAISPKGKYGRWISSHNSIIKINDILFLHGGIGPDYATTPASLINNKIRQELSNPANPRDSLSMNPHGILWYRELSRGREIQLENLLSTIFKTHDANRIVVGHTVSKKGIQLRASGKIIMIDVGMSKYYGGTASCLVIEKGKLFSVSPDSTLELTSSP